MIGGSQTITLTPGAPEITVAGTGYSLAPGGTAVVVDGQTVTVGDADGVSTASGVSLVSPASLGGTASIVGTETGRAGTATGTAGTSASSSSVVEFTGAAARSVPCRFLWGSMHGSELGILMGSLLFTTAVAMSTVLLGAVVF